MSAQYLQHVQAAKPVLFTKRRNSRSGETALLYSGLHGVSANLIDNTSRSIVSRYSRQPSARNENWFMMPTTLRFEVLAYWTSFIWASSLSMNCWGTP